MAYHGFFQSIHTPSKNIPCNPTIANISILLKRTSHVKINQAKSQGTKENKSGIMLENNEKQLILSPLLEMKFCFCAVFFQEAHETTRSDRLHQLSILYILKCPSFRCLLMKGYLW